MSSSKIVTSDEYIPALRYGWLTFLYDPLIRWTLRESTFKRQLVKQAGIEKHHRLLDLGCGTGTLTLLIKSHQVFGLDADPKVLAFARAKAVVRRRNKEAGVGAGGSRRSRQVSLRSTEGRRLLGFSFATGTFSAVAAAITRGQYGRNALISGS